MASNGRKRPILSTAWGTLRSAPRDNLNIVSAGVAFFAVLSVFPALAAAISIYGMTLGDPSALSRELDAISAILPGPVTEIIHQQMSRLAESRGGALAFSVVVSILLGLWSANNGLRTFTQALTIVHGHETRRSYIASVLISLSLTLGALIFFLAMVALLAVVPTLLAFIDLDISTTFVIGTLRWLILYTLIAGLSLSIYRWGPAHEEPRWRWIWPGALLGSLVWTMMSLGFSAVLRHVSLFSATYGSLAAVVVMMIWFYLSAYIFLIGGELNAELQRQAEQVSERE